MTHSVHKRYPNLNTNDSSMSVFTCIEFTYILWELNFFNSDYMSKFVKEHKPNLMFIHFLSIDEAGHTHSWGSPEYYQAVKVHVCSSVPESQQFDPYIHPFTMYLCMIVTCT